MTLGCQSSRPIVFSGGEQTVLEEPANLWRGWEAVGGKVTITNKRLLFVPHPLNIQRPVLEIPLDRIVAVGPVAYHRTFGGSQTARIKVQVEPGEDFEFEIGNVESFVKALRRFSRAVGD